MKNIVIICLMLSPCLVTAQKYKSTSSTVHFFSSAPVEDIEATNAKSQSVFDSESGQIVFSVPINQFQFEKSLMQEHFNENYMESDKYPVATFKAQIQDWSGLSDVKKVNVLGDLDIHGIQKSRTIEGTIGSKDGKVSVDAVFWVELVDHKIKIPRAVFYNIAEKIKVTVHFEYKPIE